MLSGILFDATFTTVIPIWPDVEDRSFIASVARVIYYIIWWIVVIRILSIDLITLTIAICLAHQFKNLCTYFEGLNSIFEGPGTQTDKEKQYEDAFKVGIKMHALTLRCCHLTQLTGGVVYSMQIIMNVSVLVMLMLQMVVVERSLAAVMPIIVMVVTLLVCTGLFMWNAGDITIEASRLPTAMFHSGWHNCQRGSSVRMRKLVTIAMTQAQERVVIKGLGIMALSYESYVMIVKSSYSLFSVIY